MRMARCRQRSRRLFQQRARLIEPPRAERRTTCDRRPQQVRRPRQIGGLAARPFGHLDRLADSARQHQRADVRSRRC